MPGPASGLRSRTTRWAARSKVVQPSHRVGASGPSSSNRGHSCTRSRASRGCGHRTGRLGSAAWPQPPAMQIDLDTIYQVVITTDRGEITMELDPQARTDHRQQLRRPGPRRLLRRPHVPPGRARLRDPGRRPRGHRPRRPRLPVRRRAGAGRVHRSAPWPWPTPGPTPTAASSSSASTTAASKLDPQLQPLRLRHRRHRRRPGRPRSATSCARSRSPSGPPTKHRRRRDHRRRMRRPVPASA